MCIAHSKLFLALSELTLYCCLFKSLLLPIKSVTLTLNMEVYVPPKCLYHPLRLLGLTPRSWSV
jgi:hypothetical protein